MKENEQKIEEIVNEYLKPLYNFVFRMVRNQNEAEDIIQETFLKVWKNIKKFDQKQNFKTWIFTIARNTTLDYFRKNKTLLFSELDAKNSENDNEAKFEDSLPDPSPLPDEIFEKEEIRKEIEKVLGELRPDFKEIIILHEAEELTFDQISKIVGKPLNTVKSHYRRALHQIRESIRI